MNTMADVVKTKEGNKSNGKKQIEKIKNIISQNKLVIGRVPRDSKIEFVKFANEFYCDDYGMAFKAIWEYYKGDVKYSDLLDRIILIEDFLSADVDIDDSKKITTLSGKRIGERKDEK